jgi:hypothetical protein
MKQMVDWATMRLGKLSDGELAYLATNKDALLEFAQNMNIDETTAQQLVEQEISKRGIGDRIDQLAQEYMKTSRETTGIYKEEIYGKEIYGVPKEGAEGGAGQARGVCGAGGECGTKLSTEETTKIKLTPEKTTETLEIPKETTEIPKLETEITKGESVNQLPIEKIEEISKEEEGGAIGGKKGVPIPINKYISRTITPEGENVEEITFPIVGSRLEWLEKLRGLGILNMFTGSATTNFQTPTGGSSIGETNIEIIKQTPTQYLYNPTGYSGGSNTTQIQKTKEGTINQTTIPPINGWTIQWQIPKISITNINQTPITTPPITTTTPPPPPPPPGGGGGNENEVPSGSPTPLIGLMPPQESPVNPRNIRRKRVYERLII